MTNWLADADMSGATIVYKMRVDRPKRRPNHVLAAKTFEGYA